MAFEKIALANAAACGIKGAYFYNGTMFFADAEGRRAAINEFRLIYPNTLVSIAGDEVVVDFVL